MSLSSLLCWTQSPRHSELITCCASVDERKIYERKVASSAYISRDDSGRGTAHRAVLIDSSFETTGGSGIITVTLAIPEPGGHYALQPVHWEGMDDPSSKDLTRCGPTKTFVIVGRVEDAISEEERSSPE